MPRVFAPSVPSKFDHASKMWIPTVELSPAEKFGQIVVMLPANAARAGVVPCIAAMKDHMRDFTAEDCIIGVGDPSLIGAASCIAVRQTGGLLRMLKWDRMAKDYYLVEVRP